MSLMDVVVLRMVLVLWMMEILIKSVVYLICDGSFGVVEGCDVDFGRIIVCL